MQHNFLFPKVASLSQWASLWHARVRWLCWQNFRIFQACNMQTQRKLLGFCQTEDRFLPDFADIKHGYTQNFYWSYSSFITGKFCGVWMRHGTLPRGLRDLYKMLPIYSSSIWHKAFDPTCRVPATIWRNPWQQKHSPAHCSNSQVRALDTALGSMVEDMKTIL